MLLASSPYLYSAVTQSYICLLDIEIKSQRRIPIGSLLGQLLWPKATELAATVFGSPFKHHMIDRREEQVPRDVKVQDR